MLKNNKLFAVLHLCVILFACYIGYMRFLRYWLADNESIAIAMLNPSQLPTTQPVIFSLLMAVLLVLIFVLIRLGSSIASVFRVIKGLYGYSVALIILQSLIILGHDQFPDGWNQSLSESQHLFVEVVADQTRLRAEPSLDAPILAQVDSGTLLLLNDVKITDDYTWNRILLAPKSYAWVVRQARIDSDTQKRLSLTYKFHFTRADQLSLVIASLGFFWGFVSYRSKKSIL